MAEQTRTIRVSTIRTALEWHNRLRGLIEPCHVNAYDELRRALDSDEYIKKLESQVEALTARVEQLEHKSAVYGSLNTALQAVEFGELERTLGHSSASREK